ncbi:MAG: helix-turn-helix domain-containing protein, partial [Gammaproteobacteria bacterium]
MQANSLVSEDVLMNENTATDMPYQNESHNSIGLPLLTKDGVDLKAHIASVEQFYIKQALDLANGVVAQAAKLLGLRRTTLVEKLKKHQFQRSTTS